MADSLITLRIRAVKSFNKCGEDTGSGCVGNVNSQAHTGWKRPLLPFFAVTSSIFFPSMHFPASAYFPEKNYFFIKLGCLPGNFLPGINIYRQHKPFPPTKLPASAPNAANLFRETRHHWDKSLIHLFHAQLFIKDGRYNYGRPEAIASRATIPKARKLGKIATAAAWYSSLRADHRYIRYFAFQPRARF